MADFAPRVRWDRVGRMALIFVGLLMLYLYINPLRTYISTWQEARSKRSEVAAQQREHRALVARQRALEAPGAVETEARRLGMVREGERAYVLRGLPRGR
jgi:cell division protein FtsB